MSLRERHCLTAACRLVVGTYSRFLIVHSSTRRVMNRVPTFSSPSLCLEPSCVLSRPSSHVLPIPSKRGAFSKPNSRRSSGAPAPLSFRLFPLESRGGESLPVVVGPLRRCGACRHCGPFRPRPGSRTPSGIIPPDPRVALEATVLPPERPDLLFTVGCIVDTARWHISSRCLPDLLSLARVALVKLCRCAGRRAIVSSPHLFCGPWGVMLRVACRSRGLILSVNSHQPSTTRWGRRGGAAFPFLARTMNRKNNALFAIDSKEQMHLLGPFHPILSGPLNVT